MVAVALSGAALATWMRPAGELPASSTSAVVQRADIIEDIIDAIEKILGGGGDGDGGGGGDGSGSGDGSGGTP